MEAQKASINKYMRKIIIKIIIISILIFYGLNKINTIQDEESENTIIEEDNSNKTRIKENLGIVQEEYKGYNVIAKLEIPIIELETLVLKDYSLEALKVSTTRFWGNEPNEIGNFCIAGHNYKEFKNLGKLKNEDEIFLTDNYNGIIKYIIYDIYIVLPNQTESLSQETNGQKEVTLITCNTNNKKRIIIKAKESV